jgi:hypothetical protein
MARAPKMAIDERAERTGMVAQFPFYDESVTRFVSWPFDAWLRCQAGFLKAAEPAATGWMERRRAAANAALDALERLSSCGDLQEAAAIQRNWLEESMKRLDSDLHALADHALAISQEAMSATRYAAQTSAEVVALAVQPAQRAMAEQPVDAAA